MRGDCGSHLRIPPTTWSKLSDVPRSKKPCVLICDLIVWAPLIGLLQMIGTSKLNWDWHKSREESFLQLVSSLKTTARSLEKLRQGKTIGSGGVMGMGKHDFFSGYQFL